MSDNAWKCIVAVVAIGALLVLGLMIFGTVRLRDQRYVDGGYCVHTLDQGPFRGYVTVTWSKPPKCGVERMP